MSLLTDDQKERLDEAADYYRFSKSAMRKTLNEILDSYREQAIRDIEGVSTIMAQMEGVRRLHAANHLRRHIEAQIEEKLGNIDQVAAEQGVDLDDLYMRRELDGD